jgi:hypothetical protein
MTQRDFVVDVKRRTGPDGSDRWTARADGHVFEAPSEAELREAVRTHILAAVASLCDVPESALTARMTRTWHVRVVEEARSDDAVDDGPVWSLFD